MPYAIALELDSVAAARVEAIAACVAAACGDRATTISSVGVPPHLSLAVYDDLPLDGVAAALDALTIGTGNTDLLISSIGAFPAEGAASVVFLAPAVTEPLGAGAAGPRLLGAISARPLGPACDRGDGARPRGLGDGDGLLRQRLGTLSRAARRPEADRISAGYGTEALAAAVIAQRPCFPGSCVRMHAGRNWPLRHNGSSRESASIPPPACRRRGRVQIWYAATGPAIFSALAS